MYFLVCFCVQLIITLNLFFDDKKKFINWANGPTVIRKIKLDSLKKGICLLKKKKRVYFLAKPNLCKQLNWHAKSPAQTVANIGVGHRKCSGLHKAVADSPFLSIFQQYSSESLIDG